MSTKKKNHSKANSYTHNKCGKLRTWKVGHDIINQRKEGSNFIVKYYERMQGCEEEIKDATCNKKCLSSPQWYGSVGCVSSQKQRLAGGSIPGQGTCLGCWEVLSWELVRGNWLMFLSQIDVSFPLFLPRFSLSKNKLTKSFNKMCPTLHTHTVHTGCLRYGTEKTASAIRWIGIEMCK